MSNDYKYRIFAIRKDDSKEFFLQADTYYPKEDHIIFERDNTMILYYDAFCKILITENKTDLNV